MAARAPDSVTPGAVVALARATGQMRCSLSVEASPGFSCAVSLDGGRYELGPRSAVHARGTRLVASRVAQRRGAPGSRPGSGSFRRIRCVRARGVASTPRGTKHLLPSTPPTFPFLTANPVCAPSRLSQETELVSGCVNAQKLLE